MSNIADFTAAWLSVDIEDSNDTTITVTVPPGYQGNTYTMEIIRDETLTQADTLATPAVAVNGQVVSLTISRTQATALALISRSLFYRIRSNGNAWIKGPLYIPTGKP